MAERSPCQRIVRLPLRTPGSCKMQLAVAAAVVVAVAAAAAAAAVAGAVAVAVGLWPVAVAVAGRGGGVRRGFNCGRCGATVTLRYPLRLRRRRRDRRRASLTTTTTLTTTAVTRRRKVAALWRRSAPTGRAEPGRRDTIDPARPSHSVIDTRAG